MVRAVMERLRMGFRTVDRHTPDEPTGQIVLPPPDPESHSDAGVDPPSGAKATRK